MLQQPPLEFCLSVQCFACGAARGERCRSSVYDNKKHGTRQYPHFGRVGMPRARGWRLEMGEDGPTALRAVEH